MSGRSGRAHILETMSYGPASYVRSLVIGFLAGNFVFLLLFAGSGDRTGYALNYLDQVRTLAACAIGCMVLALALAAAINYIVGSRIQRELEVQRELFSGPDLPPFLPHPDVPAYDLGVMRPTNPAKQPTTERETA
jgi:hypothetical protein